MRYAKLEGTLLTQYMCVLQTGVHLSTNLDGAALADNTSLHLFVNVIFTTSHKFIQVRV